MRIAFFIARYSHSGVPLAQLRLARSLARRGCEVDFVMGFVPPGVPAPDAAGLNLVDLGQSRTYRLLGPAWRFIRRARPDVVFSAEDHLNAIIALALVLAGSKAKLSASSRVTPYDTYSSTWFTKRWLLKSISRLAWLRTDSLTCVSRDMVAQYADVFGPTRHAAIYNVVVDAALAKRRAEFVPETWVVEGSAPLVISAGRLAPEKGFPDLIRAMALVLQRTPARLVILGDGPMRDELEGLVDELGLRDHVFLPGFRANPHAYFARARVFALTSYVEGLPNVLVEAMACGCTVVATDCPTGPREVLDDGRFGRLVPVHQPAALADAIVDALAHPLPAALLAEAIVPFGESEVLDEHCQALGVAWPAMPANA